MSICMSAQFCFMLYFASVYSYMITESGDKRGIKGHETTWYVMRGDKIAIPCHYKAPDDSAGEDSAKYEWKKPQYVQNRYQVNKDKQLMIEDIQLTDSAVLSCVSKGVTHKHTVLAVEEPIWANASRSMKFVSVGSCLRASPSRSKLVATIRKELCAFPQLSVMVKKEGGREKRCRVHVWSHCSKSSTSPRYDFNVTVAVDVPNFKTCTGRRVKPTCVSYEKVAQRLCMPQQKCHLDFMCHQNFSCIEQTQYGVYQDVVRFAFARMKSLVSGLVKKSSRLLHGLTPVLKPSPSRGLVDITAKCAQPGYKLHHHVLCIPCIPHTFIENSEGPTPDKCQTCPNKNSPGRFGISDCRRSPTNTPETSYRKWPKWMRIPGYLKFTTAVPTPPPTSAPTSAAAVTETTTAAPLAEVTEAPPNNSPLKAVAIVALILFLCAAMVVIGLQFKKLQAKFYSRYEELREEERQAREQEMTLLRQAKERKKQHRKKKRERLKSQASYQ